MKLGFIGLGIMGKPMCKNLIKSGYKVKVYDIDKNATKEFRDSETEIAGSVSEIAKSCDIILLMVRNSDDVRSIVLGGDGIVSHAKKETIIIDMSSISPTDSKHVAEYAGTKGIHFLDAPVSGGEPKAVDGTLSFMVGGDESIFKKVEGILKKMGKAIILIGENGSGVMTKLVNQIIVNLNIAVISEALIFGAKAGLNLEKVYKAIKDGLAGSTVLDAKFQMMIEHNFKPGGSLFVNYKDILNAIQTSQDLCVPLPFTAQLLEIMKTLKNDGKLSDDHSGIIQYFERISRVTVKKDSD